MNARAQALIEIYLRTHGQATSTDLIHLLNEHRAGVDYRKAVSRLKDKGLFITNISPPGRVAHYVLNYQPRLF